MGLHRFLSHQPRPSIVANPLALMAVLTWAPWAGNHQATLAWHRPTPVSRMSTPIHLLSMPISSLRICTINPFVVPRARSQINMIPVIRVRCGPHNLFSKQEKKNIPFVTTVLYSCTFPTLVSGRWTAGPIPFLTLSLYIHRNENPAARGNGFFLDVHFLLHMRSASKLSRHEENL
jgi:hypothetical protein